MQRNWSGMEGIDRTKKSAFTGLSSPARKKAVLTSQAQGGRRLQYPIMQTLACVIMPLQNAATSRIWIYKGQREENKQEFCNNNLMKLNLTLTAQGHWQRNSG